MWLAILAIVAGSTALIALTTVAIGTRLPELATAVVAAWTGENELGIGNKIGSDPFHLLAVPAVPGLPDPGLLENTVPIRDYALMLGPTFLLFPLTPGRNGAPGSIQRRPTLPLPGLFAPDLILPGWTATA